MIAYTNIVEKVLKKGKWKRPVRIEDGREVVITETLALPNVVFTHDMSDGFPLLTTKKVAYNTALVELEGFIKGITSKKWYQERKCRIWDDWANPQKVATALGEKSMDDPFSRKQQQKIEDDLGPMYGYQWRNFGTQYGSMVIHENPRAIGQWVPQPNGVNHSNSHGDQLKTIVSTLHQNPYDRRMVCSGWNPNQLHMMAIPPCPFAWGIVVVEDTINLYWVQRSADLMLGVPFDIANHATLLLLLAKEANLVPGNLTGLLADCHIYKDHIGAARLQLEREHRPLPTVEILERNGKFSIFDWQHTDVLLKDYNPHLPIKMEVTV